MAEAFFEQLDFGAEDASEAIRKPPDKRGPVGSFRAIPLRVPIAIGLIHGSCRERRRSSTPQ